jgi:dihydrodipicolinate synthase/N-acetylneuraminate lyase
MLLQGIFPALTTPFYPDGRVYLRKLEHNVDRYSKTPIAGMVVLGSTGEPVMLSDEERRDVLRIAAEFAAPEKVLIAGVGAESIVETLKMCECAAALDYDAALVRTPFFYKPSLKPEVLLNFYRSVADRSPLPVVLYNVPVFTGYDLPVEVVLQLAEHRNIIGMKESGGDLVKMGQLVDHTKQFKQTFQVTEVFTAVTSRMQKAEAKEAESLVSIAGSSAVAIEAKPKRKLRTKEAGFQILSGTAHQLLQAVQAGASGAVLGIAGAIPTACFEVLAAFKDNDIALAEEKQKRLIEPSKRIHSELGIAGTKYAMDWNGYYGGNCRLPLLPLTAEQRGVVETVLADLRS